MPNKLAGKTILLTGSKMIHSVTQLVEQHGGRVQHFPLIETVEQLNANDAHIAKQLHDYDWLIFTSQNAVLYFLTKCQRANVDVTTLRAKIVAVGEKTAQRLQDAGLMIHFMPSIYSADVLVQEFSLAAGERGLFVRGSLAKPIITEHLGTDEWTVYETRANKASIAPLIDFVSHCEAEPIVVFASPSAVRIYAAEVTPTIAWSNVKVASIGHITTAALATYGVTPIVQPTTYTMQAVIKQLILEEYLL